MAYDPHNKHTITRGLSTHIIINTDLPPWYKIKENPAYNYDDLKHITWVNKPIADIYYCGLASNLDVHIAIIILDNDKLALHGNYYIGYRPALTEAIDANQEFKTARLEAKPIHLSDPEFTKSLPKEINNLHWDMYNHYPEFHKIKTYGKPPKPRI